MSGQGCDVAKIQDEDVLRKMWQETEDFGRKKEIRAHMYKIREARLREFYNSGEVSKDIQRTHSSPGLREKGMAATRHADSLMDHSFLSLKSKEIRDSESPTRDITYRIGDVNKGWTVRESNERSADGKTHSTSRVASTSGKEKIQGGDLNYAAKSEQHASVYQDGDDKNFTRAVGTSSSSAIKQEARGGDENSQFYSTSSKTQSSSKFVSEHKSSSIPESQTIVRTSYTSQVPEEIIRHTDQSQNVRNTTYTSNVPEELKKHPSYVEGKTKVYTETKTLPDGSTVTTTRYETVGGKNTSQTSSFSTKRVSSSNEQKYSTENVQRSTQSTDRRQLETYSHPEIEVQYVTSTNRKQRTDTTDTRDHRVSQNIKQQQATEEKVDRSSRIDVHTSKTTDQRQVHKSEDVRNTTQQTVRKGDMVEISKISKLPDEIIVTRTHPVDQSTAKTTVVKTVENKHDESKRIASDFINVEKHHEQVVHKAPVRDSSETYKGPLEQTPKTPVKETPESLPKYEQPERRFESPVREAPSKRPQEESPKYEQPERRQPIKPTKSEMDTKPKPTEGQYSTTYRSEFTNKKISVEVSPTHDAFARSLRSVTPERDRPSKCSSPTRSFRTSTSSIRSTSTPERMRHPTRYSPDRRGTSPRKSPDQTYHRRRQDETTRTTTEVDSSTLTRRPKKKPSSRGSSPTDTVSDFEYRTRQEIVTDLDDEIDVQRKTTVDRRPNNLDLTTTRKVKKITERSPTSPISDAVRRNSPSPRRSSLKTTRPTLSSPTKQSPSDFKPFIAKTEKVLRRTDTYEERCRQILGIAEKKKVERNISDIILTDRTRPKSPEKKSPTKESPRKPALPDAARRPSPDKYSPAKEPTSPTRQSPDKPKSPSKHIKEFPSQVRRTPEKQPLESYTKRKSPTKEGPQLKEFPAQSRKTPTKQPLEPYPQRKSPVKDAPQVQEFPVQSRKTPTKQPLEPYPQRKSPVKDTPQVQEFPAQIRKSPVKEPLEPLPKRQSPVKERPQINEFPAQIRKTPTKEPQEPQQPTKSPVKEAPQIGEFPVQNRKTPERQTHPAPKQPTEPTRKEPTEKKPNVVDDLICITRDEDVRRFTTQKEHEISTVRKDTRVVEEPQRKLPKKPKTTTDEETIYVVDVDEEDTTIRQNEDFTTREVEEIFRQQKTQIRPSVTTDVIVKTVDDTTKIEENKTTTQIDEFPSQRRPSNPTTGANVTNTVETTKIINVNEQRKVPITTEEITTTTQKVKDFSSQPKSPSKPHEKSPSQKKSPTELVTDTDVTKTTRVETTRIIDVDEEDTIYPSNKRPSKPATTKDRVEQTTTTTHRFEEYPTQQKEPTTQETTNITDVHSRDVITKTIEEFPSQRKSPAKPTTPVDVTVCTTKLTTRIQEDTTSQKIKELPSERKLTTMPKTTTEKPKNTEGVPSQNKYPTKESVTPVAPKPDKDEIPTRPTEEYPDQTRVTDVTTRNRQTTSTTKVKGIQRTTEDFLVTQTTTKPSKKTQPKQHKDRKIPALKDTEDTSSDEEEETTDVTETSVTQFLDECLDEHTENTAVTSVEKFLVAEKDVTQSTQKKKVVDIRNDRKVQPKPKVDEIKESPKTKPSKKVDKPKSVTEIFIETEKVGSTNRTREEVFVDQTDKTVTISEVSDVRRTGHVPSKPKPQRPNQNVDNYPSKTATAPNQQPKTQKPLPKPDEIITPKKYTPSKQVKQPIPREPSQEEIIAHSIQYSYGAREPVDEPMMVEKKMFKVMDDEEEDIKTRVKDFIVHEQVDFEVKQSPERLSPVRRVPSENKTKPKPAQKDLPRKTTTVTQKPVEVTKRKPETIVKQTKAVPKTVVVTTCKVDLVDARKANGVPGKPIQVKPKVGAAPVKVSGVPKKPATPTPDRRVKLVDVRPTTKTSSVKTEQVNRKEVVIEIKSPKKVVEQPKKKLVSTTINLSTKPKATGVEPRKKSPVKERTPKLKPLQNGHRYTDEDDDVVPTRKPLRPSPVKQDTTKTQRKCVTTKSIIIKSAVADEREIIVDLQRSKSSREETPDRIWPITNEEDSGIPRYPDQIVEPDEPVLKKPQKLSDIPLTEGEDVNDFNRFTELIDAKITEVDRVQETDECLLTVNEKVNKFLHTADQRPRKVGPAPKVDRPQLVIDESLKSDECLLSVTDKVNKFITTAEKLKVVDVPERPKSPRCRNFEQTVKETVCEDMDEKIHKFIESTEKLTTKREKSPPKKIKPETPVEDTFETPKNTKFPTGVQETKSVKSVESTPKSTRRPSQEDKPVSSTTTRLRSTETIKKARALFEKVDKTDVERKHLNSAKKTLNYEDELNSTKVVKNSRSSMSPADKNVPSYMRDVRPKSPHKETPSQRPVDGTTPHYMAPLEKHVHHTTESLHEEKIVRHPVDGAVPHYMAPLDRAPHEHAPLNDIQPKSTRHVEEVRQRFVEQTDEVVPHYMAPLDRAPHEHSPSRDTQPKSTRHVEEVRQRFVEQTDGTVPHYMAPLDRVPHDHAPSKDTQLKSTRHVEEVRQRFVEQTDGTVPHYMAPLDRAPHEHSPSRDTQPKSTRHVEEVRQRFVEQTEGAVPHYMAPLDRVPHDHAPSKDTQPKSTRHVEEVRQRFVEQTDGTVPHYMAPLDRVPHEHTVSKDTQPKSTRHVEEVRQRFVEQTEGTVPHYMAPLDRVPHDHLPSNETQLKSTRHVEEVRQRFVEQSEGPVPHYMAPLDRAPHEHIPSQETQPKSTRNVEEIRQRFVEHSEGPVPHYMAPLHRDPHEHAPTKDLPKTTRHVEDVRQRLVEHTDETVPHYMALLDRSHHEHSNTKDTSPKSRHVEEVRQRFVEQTEGAVPHYMAPLDRAPHEHTPSKDTLAKTTRHTEEVRQRFVEQTNESVPHYMTPLDRSHHEHTQSKSTRHEERFFQEIEGEDSPELSGPDGDVPGYMKQLDRSLRTRSPHKDSVAELEEISKGHVPHEEAGKTTKFGVVLKRTDSGRIERRRSSTTVTVEVEGSKKELEIEEIYDLELLEKMLEKVVGYELRRRVRSQIRIVKKLISENKLQSVTTKKVKSKSPDKIIRTQEVHTTYKTETRRSPSPGSKASPERVQVTKSKKPETKVFTPDLKRTSAPQKKSPVEDKPEWAVQRNLKKVAEQVVPKKVTSATTVKQTQEVTTVRKTLKPEKQTDTITSSYGVGPTDENGSPLFGLRALRAQNKNETTKVQGTVMHSTFYSENGSEPVGEISLTQYSTDPKDLGSPEDLECHGEVLAKTTTKKFGQTRKAITDKKKIEDDKVRTTTTKVTRKGSVKEISQKFLENAVETLKSEKQTSYPRAGLILRTSGFKEGSGSSREGSPIESEEVQRTVQVESSSTGSFLTNTSRVTGAQDVIDRMRVEEYREEDTLEDAEARNTLNKFLGSQVLLAGMESQMKMGMTSSRSAQASASTTTSGSLKQTTITTTITENGIPKTTTRTYTHPITPDVLETIWEEQSLRLLLEQSSEYEERRIIRARLKQVMAEKEACSEFVEKAIEESDSGNVQESVETTRKTFSEGPVTKTQVTRVTSQQITKKTMSPFAKFRQLDKQNSLNTPPSTPKTPTSGGPMFKFTDPNLNRSASTIKERLLHWCQMKTREYENIKLDNFSTSWADGLAFCALIHHFLPDAFDYHQLTPNNRRYNFTLAFQVADEKADIAPLLDVDDMVATRRPDWKCVFTYVQSIYRRFKDED